MNKIILYLLLLLVCLSAVRAAEEKLIYNNWIFSEQSVYANNQVFNFWILKGQNAIVARSEETYLNINMGKCVTEGYIKICYYKKEYDIKEKEYKANVKIYSLKPDIDITRSIDKISFLIGEEATISVEIKNNGAKKAQDATYTERFPSFVEITDIDGGSIVGSTVVWHGNLAKDKTKEIKYTIRSSKELNQKIRATFDYFDGSTNKTIYSNILKLNIKHFLDITPVWSKNVIVGGKANLTLNLSNNHYSDIKINSLKIDVPQSFKVLKYPGRFKKTGNSFLWEGDIDKNRTIKNEFRFKTKRVGINTIFITANISYNDKTEVIRKQTDLAVRNINLFINTNLDDNEILEAGYKKRIKIWVQNPNPYLKFTNVHIKFDTNITSIDSIYLNVLNTTEQKKIVDLNFIVPNITSTKNYPFKITAEYKTEYGDLFTEKLEIKNLKVEPIKPLTVTHFFSKKKAEGDEEIRLVVKVKNNRNVNLKGVVGYDNSSSLLTKEGVSSAWVDIDGKDTVTIYSYLITAPKILNETKFPITTTLNYNVDDIEYTDTKTSYLTVVPKKIKISIKKSLDKKDDYFAGQMWDVDYTIKNTEEEGVRDITIHFPKQQDFDIVNRNFYFLEQLGPGEEITLNKIEKLRPKINGSLKIDESYITYKDEEGNVFSTNSNRISIRANRSYMQGPVIFIEKSAPDEVEEGKSFDVNLTVKNIGDTIGEIYLNDFSFKRNFNLAPGKEIAFTYKTKIYKDMELKPAEARYHYLAMPFYAYSNGPEVKIVREKVKVEKPAPVVEKDKEIKSVKETELTGNKIKSQKGFFGRLWILFVDWFSGR